MIIKKFINGKIVVEKQNEVILPSTDRTQKKFSEEDENVIKKHNVPQEQTSMQPKRQITYYQKPSSLPTKSGGCGCGGR